ncbi:hypothetical protein CCHL11_08660 [Colletotrichum chlorophyti]|uniref:Uncharacterized protein n=1 Tax=Colletotrichum chlorophyti TaxID=708187 RepID=A0A1Q8RCW5_9PEZI|nr:hypothetical protein CCHL11_08660 [Colletotrichum chlorophyti]
MSLHDPSVTKQQRIQTWREEVAASASLCTCPPSSPAASSSSTNISLSIASSSASSTSSPGAGDAFTFPRGDILPSQSTYCPTCSRLGAPPAMGMDPSAIYLDETHHLPNGHGPGSFFRTKHGNHAIFRGMRNLVRKLSGSTSGRNGPLPPRAPDEATKMYRRATVAGFPGITSNAAAAADAELAIDEADSGERGYVSKVIAEKQGRLKRASMLLARSHGFGSP